MNGVIMSRTVFVFSLLSVVLLGCSRQQAEKVDARLLVRVGSVRRDVAFTDALRVQGSVRAKDTTSVSARVPGTIDALLVEEGARVAKGTPLFQVDRVNLENAVRAARDDLAMARAKVAQAKVSSEKAALDAERLKRLLAGAAVTKDMFEKAEVGAKSAAAALEAAEALRTKAETGLAVAEKNLADSRVVAPFDAVVTRKHKSAGDYVGPGAKVFDLENPSAYEICVTLNAAQYARVRTGETRLRLARPVGGARDLTVTYKAPTVSSLTRTFEVRALLPRTDAVAAGMLLDGEVVFAERKGQGLPASAVADRGGGDCVFVVKDGRVGRLVVEAGLETDGWREIVKPALSDDVKIILEGMLLVSQGDEVRTREQPPSKPKQF